MPNLEGTPQNLPRVQHPDDRDRKYGGSRAAPMTKPVPHPINRGEWMGLEITCPTCGAALKTTHGQGACKCENGHHFWDTDAPEWQALSKKLKSGTHPLEGSE